MYKHAFAIFIKFSGLIPILFLSKAIYWLALPIDTYAMTCELPTNFFLFHFDIHIFMIYVRVQYYVIFSPEVFSKRLHYQSAVPSHNPLLQEFIKMFLLMCTCPLNFSLTSFTPFFPPFSYLKKRQVALSSSDRNHGD